MPSRSQSGITSSRYNHLGTLGLSVASVLIIISEFEDPSILDRQPLQFPEFACQCRQ